jgi:hypothetical protein
LPKSASQPTLADTRWSFDDQVLRLVDPTPGDQRLKQCAVEAAGGSVVDVLDRSLVP